MVLNEFRILHSTLIEHYQFIEAHLEGIYAAVSDKPFVIGLQEVEKDSLSGVVREIKELEREKKSKSLPKTSTINYGQSSKDGISGAIAVILKWPLTGRPVALPKSEMSRNYLRI